MKAVGQAQNALAALAALLPDEADLVDGDTIRTVPASDLQVGDVVLVRPGARVPADGTIVDGAAEIDESMITGESKPVGRSVGDRVVASTVTTDSSIRVRVEAVGDDTTLAGIQRLVADAQASQSRAQVLADRFAALLFYVAVAAGIVTFLVWWAMGDVEEAIVRTVTVLVIACPHALGLAIPLVIALSTAVSARSGILVKDRLALERMRSIETVLFDKTGTLTMGAHAVTGVAATSEFDHGRVLRTAAAVEAESEHPLARAIIAAAAAVTAGAEVVPKATGFRSIAGRGVTATVEGVNYAVGGPALLRQREFAVPDLLRGDVDAWERRGAAVLYLANDHAVVGAMALEDEVRPEARQAVEELRRMGIDVAMITGDARQVAEAVARDLGIANVFAEVLPEDKDQAVSALQRRGHDGGHGRRRSQRCPGSCPCRCRPGDRRWHRCGHRVGRRRACLERPTRRRQRDPPVSRQLPQDDSEPCLGGRIQRGCHSGGRRRVRLGGRHVVACGWRRSDEPLDDRGGAQRPTLTASGPQAAVGLKRLRPELSGPARNVVTFGRIRRSG